MSIGQAIIKMLCVFGVTGAMLGYAFLIAHMMVYGKKWIGITLMVLGAVGFFAFGVLLFTGKINIS